nr:NUDIX domain-containing protein [Novosphingobium taihuense]
MLPGPFHRSLLRSAHALRLWWWRRTARFVRGCNVIVANPAGHVLLVRHSYHARNKWMLPGGGLGRHESPLDTATRELFEETGCRLERAEHLGTILLDRSGWTNAIELVTGTTRDTPVADGREIEEARFFPPDTLPESATQAVRAMIARWLDAQNGNSA